MSVSAIGSISGTRSVTGTYAEFRNAARRRAADDPAAGSAAAKMPGEDRNAVARAREAAQQADQQAHAAEAARRAAEQQVLPVGPIPMQQSKPVTASPSALGGSFDVMV
jgi:hypothetical protein